MRNKGRIIALATSSLAVIGAGAGVVEASPTAVAAQHTTGHYSACLTSDNTLVNVTVSPQHRIACPADTERVTWNARGPRGHRGHVGPKGAKGSQGVAGVPGEDGSTVLNGSGAPSANVGAAGDFYIDTTSWTIYGPKTANGWPATGQSLRGPQGPAGSSGTAAADGTTVLGHLENGAEAEFACGTPSGFSVGFDCTETEPFNGTDPASATVPVDSVLSNLTASIPAPLDGDTAVLVFDEEGLIATGPEGQFFVGCTIPAGDTSCTSETIGYAAAGDHLLVVGGPVFFDTEATSGSSIASVSYGYTMTPGDVPVVEPPVRTLTPQLRSSHNWLR